MRFGRNPLESSTDKPWSAEAVELFRDLVRARLSGGRCTACNASLATALVVRTNTSVGPELNELGLSDEAAAHYLAVTDDLIVKCGQCGARKVVPGG